METLLKQCVGIDIAKASFKACLASIDLSQKLLFKSVKGFENTKEGFSKMLTWIDNLYDPSTRLTFVMEATGVYYENLAFFTIKSSMYLLYCQTKSIVMPRA